MSEAQYLLNLFRQNHVFADKLESLNKKFLTASAEALEALKHLPTGTILLRHIDLLKTKKVPLHKIAKDCVLFPELTPPENTVILSEEKKETSPVNKSSGEETILRALDSFRPDNAHLNTFKQDLGINWKTRLMDFVSKNKLNASQQQAYETVLGFSDAIDAWHKAESVLQEDNQVKARSILSNLETVLPQFGSAGQDLLMRVKRLANQ